MKNKLFEIRVGTSAKELLDKYYEAEAKEPGLTFLDFTERISWKK